jgi:hypothetical protein
MDIIPYVVNGSIISSYKIIDNKILTIKEYSDHFSLRCIETSETNIIDSGDILTFYKDSNTSPLFTKKRFSYSNINEDSGIFCCVKESGTTTIGIKTHLLTYNDLNISYQSGVVFDHNLGTSPFFNSVVLSSDSGIIISQKGINQIKIEENTISSGQFISVDFYYPYATKKDETTAIGCDASGNFFNIHSSGDILETGVKTSLLSNYANSSVALVVLSNNFITKIDDDKSILCPIVVSGIGDIGGYWATTFLYNSGESFYIDDTKTKKIDLIKFNPPYENPVDFGQSFANALAAITYQYTASPKISIVDNNNIAIFYTDCFTYTGNPGEEGRTIIPPSGKYCEISTSEDEINIINSGILVNNTGVWPCFFAPCQSESGVVFLSYLDYYNMSLEEDLFSSGQLQYYPSVYQYGIGNNYHNKKGINLTGQITKFKIYNIVDGQYSLVPSPSSGIDNNTILMLHCDGTNGSTSFVDSSPSAHTVTANGDAQVSTAQSKFGGASGYLPDGSRDYLTATTDNLNFTGNLTVDGWFLYNSAASNEYPTLIANGQGWTSGNIAIQVDAQANLHKLQVVIYDYSPSTFLVSSSSVDDDAWHHFALVRDGENLNLFIDGDLEASIVYADEMDFGLNGFIIGQALFSPSNSGFTGYLDELRVSNVARWTENFTPPKIAYGSVLFYKKIYGEFIKVGENITINFYADENKLYKIADYTTTAMSGVDIEVSGKYVGVGTRIVFDYNIT